MEGEASRQSVGDPLNKAERAVEGDRWALCERLTPDHGMTRQLGDGGLLWQSDLFISDSLSITGAVSRPASDRDLPSSQRSSCPQSARDELSSIG